MAYTDIDKPTDYFNTVTYSGNGSTQSITGVGFQPDWVWIKRRSSAQDHVVFDINRGATKWLKTNSTDSELTYSNSLQSFDSDGFTLGGINETNASSQTYASWNWLASNTTASNTDGTITSTVSANTTSGFSIVSYTGNQLTTQTVGHGLGVTPKMIIVKNRSTIGAWMVYHESLGVSSGTIQRFIQLDNSNAQNNGGSGDFPTAPTSSVFGIGNYETMNKSGDSIIAYCFAEKKGFSKFGSYTGNGSTDGTFVYTGFKPAFVILKNTTNYDWHMFDNTRNAYNITNSSLKPNTSGAEYTNNDVSVDLLSNGFKFRGTDIAINQSGTNHIYMAFAENPFVTSTGIPTTAR